MCPRKKTERPRVEGDRESEILDACVDLLVEVGYHRLTMDAVAREARASKATLYRRWESKPDLVIDALVRAKGMPHVEAADTGSLRGDLIATFAGRHGVASPRSTEVLGSLITAMTTDAEFADRFRAVFIAPKIAVSRSIYERAVERGEISADLDLEIIAPTLAGVVLHRTFILGEPSDAAIVERVIDHLIMPAVTAAGSPSQPHTPEKDS